MDAKSLSKGSGAEFEGVGAGEEEEEEQQQRGNFADESRMTLWLALAMGSTMGSFLFGYSLGFTSPALPAMEGTEIFFDTKCHGHSVRSTHASLFVSALSIGGGCGALMSGKVSDTIGRTRNLLLSAISFSWGYTWLALVKHRDEAIICRFIIGLGAGSSSMVVPMYISEVSPSDIRGALCALNQLTMTIGIVAVFAIGDLLPHESTTFNNCTTTSKTIGNHWRVLALVGAVVSGMMVFLTLFLPESPVFHNQQGKRELGIRAGKRFGWASKQIYELTRAEEAGILEEPPSASSPSPSRRAAEPASSFSVLFSKGNRSKLAVACGVMALQQWCGVNAVNMYCAQIFRAAGFSDTDRAGVYASVSQFAGVCASIYLVERTGRRTLLIISEIAMLTTLVVLGLFFYLPSSDREGWIALTSVMAFMFSFAIGIGPVVWIVINEMFPDDLRGSAGSISVLVNWVSAFLVTQFFLEMEVALNTFGVFWFYGVVLIAGLAFTLLAVPETMPSLSSQDATNTEAEYKHKGEYQRVLS